MLPARDKGRKRDRNRGQDNSSGRPQLKQNGETGGNSENASVSFFRDESSKMRYPQQTDSQRNSSSSDSSADGKRHPPRKSHKTERKSQELPEELGIQFKRKLSMRTKPEEGTLGKRIKLISNCFPLKCPSGCVYHYDIKITRRRKNNEREQSNTEILPAGADQDKKYSCLSTKRNRQIVTLMLETNPLFNDIFPVYDGRQNLITRHPLHADFPIRCEVVLPDENANPDNPVGPQQDVFLVEIKPVIKKDSNSCAISLDSLHALYEQNTSSVPQEAVMALDIILRHGPCLRFTPIGRSFFYPPNMENMHPLGGGLEIWFGYHQSVRLGQWGPMVNLDRTATTFYQKGPLISYIADFFNTTVGDLRRRPFLSNTDVRRISNRLKNLRVEVTHLRYRRKYRIVRLVKENANRLEFEMTIDGRTVKRTVAAYFRERYNRILEFPNLPCLQVCPESKNIFLPIEVCEIVEGQHSKRKLEGKQRTEMIKFTAVSPNERFSEIKQIANDAAFNRDRHILEFDLEVSREPIRLEGRVLDSPKVRYKDGETIKPKDGSWNMRSSKFLRGAIINAWVLLSFADLNKPVLKKFSDLLTKMGKETGMAIDDPVYTDVINFSKCDLKRLLSCVKNKYKADLAVIVLPSNDKSIYGKIKQAAETVIGLATQCIKEINVANPRKCCPQLINNICQKINSKTGGENNSLVPCEIPPILHKPAIIIGADVNHPGPSSGVKPSLAACVGSLDNKLSRYAVSIRAQANVDERKKSIEIIVDLKMMVSELLRAFYRHTNRMKPEKIIFYRDGVSEGQFEKVRDHEVKCIREACKNVQADYEPGITFIVVQKRHHTRFMPQDPRDGVGAMQNIPPGTTVDTAVTDPLNFDFYLCSHFGLKGTSRPSHYTVIEDDNEFSANDIQKLTYQLCHTYARCTRSISIPVPVAYADLAAYRARQHLEAALEESTASSDSSAENELGQTLSQSIIDSIKVIGSLQNAMYFV